MTRHVFTTEEQAEFDAWEKLRDETWAMIDQWEKEEAMQDDRTQPPDTHA